MTTLNDEWVRAAFNDDTLVVHLLLHLKKNPVSSSKSLQAQLPLKWGFKQPRSSSTSRPRLPPPPPPPPAATAVASASRCDGGGVSATRCSPTTPLSWSGGASPSDTADGNEDSNRHHASRSKATATSGYTGNSASTKKCKRKKTFAQLKEEESSLLKERTYLEKEIANVNANFEAARAKNERMKRIKLDIGTTKSHNNPSSTNVELHYSPVGQPHQRIVPSEIPKVRHATQDDTRSHASESRGSFSLIPDLNMAPPDDDSYTEDLCGMR